jgi:hypothetical protein
VLPNDEDAQVTRQIEELARVREIHTVIRAPVESYVVAKAANFPRGRVADAEATTSIIKWVAAAFP